MALSVANSAPPAQLRAPSAARLRRQPASRSPPRGSGLQTRAQTITETVVDVATPTGTMRTYVLKPTAPGRYPGIVFYSEIFQARGQRAGPAEQLSAAAASSPPRLASLRAAPVLLTLSPAFA